VRAVTALGLAVSVWQEGCHGSGQQRRQDDHSALKVRQYAAVQAKHLF
jgi:hypothetical protein